MTARLGPVGRFASKVAGPAAVFTLAPTSTKRGSPVYPGHACCGLGNSFPLKLVRGSVLPFPGKKTGQWPAAPMPCPTFTAAPIAQGYAAFRYDPRPVVVRRVSLVA